MHLRGTISVGTIFLLLMASLAMATSGPGERAEPKLEGAPGSTFLSVAVAAGGAWMVGGTTDPGSLGDTPSTEEGGINIGEGDVEYPPGKGPDVDVWHLWQRDGTLRDFNSADPPSCSDVFTQGFDASEDCSTPAGLVAMSANGQRFAVGGLISGGDNGGQNARSLVTFLDQQGGARTATIEGAIKHLAMDDQGISVIALTQLSAQLRTTTNVYAFPFGVTDGQPDWARTGLPGAPADLDFSSDGQRIVVAADESHRFIRLNDGVAQTDTQTDSDARAIGVADVHPYWSVTGFESGKINIYQDSNAEKLQFGMKLTSRAQTAGDISSDGKYAVMGDDSGVVRFFAIDGSAAEKMILLSDKVRFTGTIDDVQFSRDGAYVAVVSTATASGSTKSTLHLFGVSDNGLDRLWSDTRSSTITDLSMDAPADLIAIVAGGKVVVYQASHDVRLEAAGTVDIAPKEGKDVSLTVNNRGNRDETISFTIDGPENWFLNLSKDALDLTQSDLGLGAGDSATVKAHFVVAADQTPGTFPVWINHTLASGGSASKRIDVSVPFVSDLAMAVNGPASLAVQAGGFASFPVVISNNGNDAQTATLSVTIDQPGWTASVAPPKVDVPRGGSKTVHVDIRAPNGAAELETATARLTIAEVPGLTATVSATVDASFQPGLEAPSSVKVPIGGLGAFNVTVTNLGNARDSYVLTAGSLPSGWRVLVAADEGSTVVRDLEPGDEVRIEVRVEPPADAADAVTVPMLVKVTSQGDGERSIGKNVLLGLVRPAGVDETGGDGDNGSPGVGLVAVLALLGAVAWIGSRRHPRGP